jgi:dephospho-CoA kinase
MVAMPIAVTGGIASGKSALCEAFVRLGRPLVDADRAARDVVAPGTPGLAAVVEAFGDGVLTAGGELDRAALRAWVFADPAERRRLEALLHPLIRERMRREVEAAAGPYVLVAIPLLAESRADYAWLTRVLVVDVPETLQVARVMQRDAIDREQALRILAAQASRHERLRIATDVVVNDGSLARLDAIARRLDARWCGAADNAPPPA